MYYVKYTDITDNDDPIEKKVEQDVHLLPTGLSPKTE